MNLVKGAGVVVLLSLGGLGSAGAALLNPAQKYPDITLSGNLQMIWNGNAGGGGTLTVSGLSSTLNLAAGGTVSAGTQYTQSNQVATTTSNDVNNGNGDLGLGGLAAGNKTFMTFNLDASGNLLSGSITIPVGTANAAAGNASFGWRGDVTNFGWQSTGTTSGSFAFDGYWNLLEEDYNFGTANAANASYVDNVNGTSPLATGGFKLNVNTNFNSTLVTSLFGSQDWYVSGSTLNATQITNLGLSSPVRLATSVTGVDVFVPVPAAIWLMGSAFTALAAFGRRRRLAEV